MHILLTNDDGIEAPALKRLAEFLCRFAQVTCIAPAEEQSGVSQKFTFLKPLGVKEPANWPCKAFAIGGSPADCVKLGLHELVDSPVDLVISGVNKGVNLGVAVLYSGTVAAAREAILWNVPALALSTVECSASQLSDVEHWLETQFFPKLQKAMKKSSCWNVNFPVETAAHKGEMRVCAQGLSMYEDKYVRNDQGEYVLEGLKDPKFFKPDTDDFYWEQGFITLVPLQINQTAVEEYDFLRNPAAFT